MANRSAARPKFFTFFWIVFIGFLIVPFLFVRAYVLPTGSMEDTLLIGDHFLVQVFPRVTPQRGDIVAFVYPINVRMTLVKRVVGVPGDRILIKAKVVSVNGKPLKEGYAIYKIGQVDAFRDNLPHDAAEIEKLTLGPDVEEAAMDMLTKHVVNGEVVVPAGEYFVLGDNRDNSLDSRYWGFLPERDIVGKPFLIYASLKESASGAKKVRWERIFRRI